MTTQEINEHPWYKGESAEQTRAAASIRNAAATLSQSERGRQVATELKAFLRGAAISLDSQNQKAVRDLIAGAHGAFPGSVNDLLGMVGAKPRKKAKA